MIEGIDLLTTLVGLLTVVVTLMGGQQVYTAVKRRKNGSSAVDTLSDRIWDILERHTSIMERQQGSIDAMNGKLEVIERRVQDIWKRME